MIGEHVSSVCAAVDSGHCFGTGGLFRCVHSAICLAALAFLSDVLDAAPVRSKSDAKMVMNVRALSPEVASISVGSTGLVGHLDSQFACDRLTHNLPFQVIER